MVTDQQSLKDWIPPPLGWLKCNIGSSWDKQKKLSGAAWTLSNADGEVLLHSRRAFSNIDSDLDANLEGWLWATESMVSLRYNKIIFGAESKYLVGAVTRPPVWPSYRFHSSLILKLLHRLRNWKVQVEEIRANIGAYLIALSVTKEDRLQSYIAVGLPRWIKYFFWVFLVVLSLCNASCSVLL